jgi:hypothetical protein
MTARVKLSNKRIAFVEVIEIHFERNKTGYGPLTGFPVLSMSCTCILSIV